MDTLNLYADIIKSEVLDDGTLLVEGKATGPDLDIDRQRMDPAWLAQAMPAWYASGANVREMHQPIAAGVGQMLEERDDGWYLKALVVDPGSVTKVRHGVLKGFSIGVKHPQVVKHASAPKGLVNGGEIVEVSLVDRPALHTAKMSLCKAAESDVLVEGDLVEKAASGHEHEHTHEDGGHSHPHGHAEDGYDHDDGPHAHAHNGTHPLRRKGVGVVDADADEETVKSAYAELMKRSFTAEQRRKLEAEGKAMPGGSFPIETVGDLRNAIRTAGLGKGSRSAIVRFIKRRAKALGRADLIPESWKAVLADLDKAGKVDPDEGGEWTHSPAELRETQSMIANFLIAEIEEMLKGDNELYDISSLAECLGLFTTWWSDEAAEGETTSPFDSVAAKAAIDELVKTALEEAKTTLDTLIDSATTTAGEKLAKLAAPETTKAVAEDLAVLSERLAQVEQMARPGGPVRTRTESDARKSATSDRLRAEIAHYTDLASTVTDVSTASAYRELAAARSLDLAKLA
jgi:hypothetical protein